MCLSRETVPSVETCQRFMALLLFSVVTKPFPDDVFQTLRVSSLPGVFRCFLSAVYAALLLLQRTRCCCCKVLVLGPLHIGKLITAAGFPSTRLFDSNLTLTAPISANAFDEQTVKVTAGAADSLFGTLGAREAGRAAARGGARPIFLKPGCTLRVFFILRCFFFPSQLWSLVQSFNTAHSLAEKANNH